MQFENGKQYRVAVEKASLFGWTAVSQGGGAFYEQGYSHPLSKGDIVFYAGMGYTGGSDGIHEHRFRTKDGKCGFFQPQSWSRIPDGALEEV